MGIVTIDEKRRIVIPKEVIDRFGARFVMIEIKKEGVFLKPLPENPLEALQKEGERLRGISRKTLRQHLRKQAEKDVC